MKNKALKLASVLLAVTMLLSVFSVSATDLNGYFKTIASADFEEANPLSSKVENVSITTLSNGSTGYLYANPTGIKNISVAPIQGLQQGKQYTYMVDLYIIDYSNDANGCITRLDLANMDGQLVEAYLGKDRYNLNQWYTYSKTVTYNTTLDSWFSIYTFGEARVIYDNVRIVDENGTVVYIEDFEVEKHTFTEGFSYIHDYSNGSVDANDKVLRLTNDTTGVPYSTLGEFPLGEESTETTYTLTYDYLIKRKSTGSLDFAFKYSSYCAECQGAADFGHKPYGDKEHYIGEGKETGKWYTDTLTIKFSDKCDNTYAEIHLFQNADVLFDNIVVKDSNGNVVKNFDMNSGTVPGKIGRGDFGGTIEFPVKNELIWLKGAPNLTDGHFYANTKDLIANNKAIDITFEASAAIAANKYPTVTFDYKMNGKTNESNGVTIAVSFNGITEPAYSRNYFKLNDTNGEWVTADAVTFTNLDVREGVNTLNLVVYGGFELEIDNIKLENSGATVANIDFATNGTFTEDSDVAIVNTPKDYAVLVDNSAGTGFGQLYLHEVGMPYSNVYPVGTYTFTFDFYALEIGASKNIVAHLTQPGWSGDAFPGTSGQKWLEIEEKIGEWQTVSFEITTIAEGQFPWFYIGAGLKGYLDNFKIVEKNTAITLIDVPFAEGDLGKTSKDINTVVDLPADIAFKTNANYGVLVDNSANSGFGQLYLHEVGMPYSNVYPVGDYTIKFDFYALEIGASKNIVAHLTQPGWSGDAFPGTSGQKWLEIEEKIGEWQTVSFDITTIAEGQFPWFYIGAGLKGYLDNFTIIDKTNNTTLLETSFTKADLGKVSKDINTVVAMPETLFENNNVTTVEGDTYTISFIKDNEGMKTYGSNGVLYINTDKWMGYTFNKGNIGADILSGKKYRLSFDYDVLTPGTNTNEWSIAIVEVKTDKEGDHNDYVTTDVPVSGSKSYEFIATGNNNVYVAVNTGCEVVIDNIVLEEFVNYPTLGVQKRQGTEEDEVAALAYGMKLHSADSKEYIYTINGDAVEVAEKGFIAALSNHVEGELTLDVVNPYVKVIKVTNAAETITDGDKAHNVYTLAVTEPEADRSISVRPYVKGTDGNVYYGDATIASANDLADNAFNTWIGASVSE